MDNTQELHTEVSKRKLLVTIIHKDETLQYLNEMYAKYVVNEPTNEAKLDKLSELIVQRLIQIQKYVEAECQK